MSELDAGWGDLELEADDVEAPISPLPPLPAIDLYAGAEPHTLRRPDLLESQPEDENQHPADAEDRTVQKFVQPDIMDLDYELDHPTANLPSEWLDHLAARSARRSDLPPSMVIADPDAEDAVTSTLPMATQPQPEGNESITVRPPSFVDSDPLLTLPPIPRPAPIGPLADMLTPPPISSKPYAVFVPPPPSSQRLPVAGGPHSLNTPTPISLRRGRPITWRPGRPEPAPKKGLRPLTRNLVLLAIVLEVALIAAVLVRLLK